MSKHWAYLDRNGILYLVEKRDTAIEYAANGKVVETDYPSHHGHPKYEGETLVVYGPEDMRRGTKGKQVIPVPELAALYRKLM